MPEICEVSEKSSVSHVECNDDDENDSDEEVEPVISKKIKKEVDDRRFTIETTVTVQKTNKHKKVKKEKC
jgi:hypothetical protein